MLSIVILYKHFLYIFLYLFINPIPYHLQVTHSLGGGTGSGVGTYMLSLLADLYPKIYKFSACVYPSEENDVVTSPYNTVLAMKELVEHADCVFPMDNSALFQFSK